MCDLPEEAMEPGLNWDMWLGPAPKRAYNSILSPRGVHKGFPAWRELPANIRVAGMTDWGAHHFDITQWGLGMDDSGPVEIIPPEDPKANTGVRFIYANGVESSTARAAAFVHRNRRANLRQPRQVFDHAREPGQGPDSGEWHPALQVHRPLPGFS